MEPTLKECPTCEGAGTIETYSPQGGGEGEIAYQDDCPDCLGGTLSKETQSILWDVSCAMLCDAPQPEWGKVVAYIASLEADRDRMEWFERNGRAAEVFDPPSGDAWVWCLAYYADKIACEEGILSESQGGTLRETIDDARKTVSPDLSFIKSDPSIGLEPITE